MSELQQKLTQIKGLLPSQRQWLERLVFQLEFNPYQLIYMVGGPGTGKTTLTLAIADLLSNQFNLALISAEPELTAVRVRQHVLEHWFGVCKDAGKPLLQLVGDRELTEPLALIIDNAENLPAELWAELADLPCLVIAASEQPQQNAELNLPLPALSLEDAQMLLEGSGLNTLTVADRMDTAMGNMHILLDPSLARRQQPKTEIKPASLAKPLLVFTGGMALIGAVVFFWFWTEQQGRPAGLGELTYLPEEQEVVVQAPGAAQTPNANKAVVEELVGKLEQVGSKTTSSSAQGLAKPVDFAAAEQGGNAVDSTVDSAVDSPSDDADTAANNQSQPQNTGSEADVNATTPAETTIAVTEQEQVATTAGAADDSLQPEVRQEVQPEALAKVPDLSQQEPKPENSQQLAAETELSVADEMSAEVGNATTSTNNNAAAETADDLASEAQAELQRKAVTPAPSAGGYAYQESELLSMSGMALQLVVFSNKTALDAFLAAEPGLQTYTYQRVKNGQRQLVVVMAPFADSVEAKAKIAALPAALQQAFVKPLADIHSEISVQ